MSKSVSKCSNKRDSRANTLCSSTWQSLLLWRTSSCINQPISLSADSRSRYWSSLWVLCSKLLNRAFFLEKIGSKLTFASTNSKTSLKNQLLSSHLKKLTLFNQQCQLNLKKTKMKTSIRKSNSMLRDRSSHHSLTSRKAFMSNCGVPTRTYLTLTLNTCREFRTRTYCSTSLTAFMSTWPSGNSLNTKPESVLS